MALFTESELTGAIPAVKRLLAFDDDSDHIADDDVFPAILADAEAFVGGYLQQAGIALWPSPIPLRLKQAGMRHAEYTLYTRRGMLNDAERVMKDWLRPAMAWLERVGSGEETMTPGQEPEIAGAIVSEDMRSHSADGSLMV